MFLAFLIQVNRLNMNIGTTFKLEGHGDGPRSLCMNCAGLGLAIMIALIRSKHCLEKGFLISMTKKCTIWHLLRGITLWAIWIKCNDKVFTTVNGMNPRSSIGFGINSSSTPKQPGNICLNKSRLAASLRRLCSKVLTMG